MGSSRLLAGSVGAYLSLLPNSYAVKTARRLRRRLEAFAEESQPVDSPAGPLHIAGVSGLGGEKRHIGMKEPDTVRWIETCVRAEDVFWDAGANVGLYTIYAAKRGVRAVYAFEPYAPTYLQLLRNLVRNGVDRQVRALNIALAESTGIGDLPLSTLDTSGATLTLSGHIPAADKAKQTAIGVQYVQTWSAADFAARNPAAAPDHIKIDVDGSEAAILRGLTPLLPRLGSVLVEVLDSFTPEFEQVFKPQLEANGLTEVAVAAPKIGRNRIFLRQAASGPRIDQI